VRRGKTRVHIFLTGGLGNQLFQLAAALDLSKKGEVSIYDTIGKPRVNAFRRPEIESLELPEKVSCKSVRFNWFISKIVGFNLRSGFSPNQIEVKTKRFISLVSALIMSVFLRKPLSISQSLSIGFDSSLSLNRRDTLVVGYFQTYKHIESIGLGDFINFPTSSHDKVKHYRRLASQEKPLIVHIRLGDYINEENIGILDASYYETSLNLAWDTQRYKKIWLFSDEPNQAQEKIPDRYKRFVSVIDSTELSSAETLELLTLGDGYIIANSTFSWWGAYLRKNQSAVVYCPVPWFKNLDEPMNIVPSQWKRVDGFKTLE
jgi:hypothetical protein